MKLKGLLILALVCTAVISAGVLTARAEGGRSQVGDGLKARFEGKFEQKDVRNERVEDRKEMRASTTEAIRDMRDDFRDDRKEMRASSTMILKEFKGERKELMHKMQVRVFQMRKDLLVRELTMALANLDNIAARIAARITQAESSGRDMTTAKADLVIANNKLTAAKVSVSALASFQYSTSTTATTTATTTAEVDLERPRKIGDDAIKAVKEARDAFKKVVSDIARAMGLGHNDGTATTTATTTVPTTSTSTATTTTI